MRDVGEVVAAWAEARPRALLLDFNGTLSDDEELLGRIFADIVADRWGGQLSAPDYRARLLGLSDREIAERLALDHDEPAAVPDILRERQERYLRAIRECSPITAGAAELVRRAHRGGARIGVVTGAQRREVEEVLVGSGLREHIEVLVCVEDVRAGKPDPEGYLAACETLEVEPAHCLVFEDSPVGVQAALAAGMSVIGVGGSADVPGVHAVTSGLVGDLL